MGHTGGLGHRGHHQGVQVPLLHEMLSVGGRSREPHMPEAPLLTRCFIPCLRQDETVAIDLKRLVALNLTLLMLETQAFPPAPTVLSAAPSPLSGLWQVQGNA